jgi:hypothetical protein
VTGKSVLLVEGIDDEHVVKHICGQHQLGVIGTIHPCGGKDELLDSIVTRAKESNIAALGILLDADEDIQARWQAVFDRLASAGYSGLPRSPSPDGTVVEPPADTLLPRVGIWLMPDNRIPGILEHFLAFLIPAGDGLIAHADQAIDTIPTGQRLFPPEKEEKARVHTWLAWQREPGKPFGTAISFRYLDPNLPAAETFARWLQRTFFS